MSADSTYYGTAKPNLTQFSLHYRFRFRFSAGCSTLFSTRNSSLSTLRSPLFVLCPPFHILILHSLLSVLTFSHLIAEAVLHFGDIFAVALHPSFSTLHSPFSILHSPFSILCHQSFRTRTSSRKQCRISAFGSIFAVQHDWIYSCLDCLSASMRPVRFTFCH